MILLFNTSHNILTGEGSDKEVTIPLLPDHAVVMTVDYAEIKIERVGKGWRATPSLKNDEQWLAKKVSNWQQAQVKAVDGELPESPLVVVTWLAGESNGRVFQLFSQNGQDYVFHNGQLFELTNVTISELIL